MELTRRDALSALGGIGLVTSGGGLLVHRRASMAGGEASELDAHELKTLSAATDFVYPSEVSATDGFVSAYAAQVSGRRKAELRRTLRQLDAHTRTAYGRAFADVSVSRREALVRRLGVNRVSPKPTGSLVERISYYLINGLLYILFTSPKGTALLGIDNPTGHPGGYASYTDSPEE